MNMILEQNNVATVRSAVPNKMRTGVAFGRSYSPHSLWREIVYGAPIALMLIYPLYGHLLPEVINYTTFLLGAFLAIFVFFVSEDGIRFNMKDWGIGALWLAVLGVAVTGFFIGGHQDIRLSNFVTFSVLIIVTLMLAIRTQWIRPAIVVSLVLLLTFALATIAMYLMPNVEAFLRRTLLASMTEYKGYRSGISSHYSLNGHFIALGAILGATLLFFSEHSRKTRLLYCIYTLVMLWALLLTTKRTAFICVIVTISVVYLTSKGGGKYLKFAISAITIVFLIYAFGSSIPGFEDLVGRFDQALSGDSIDETTNGRGRLWEFAFEGFMSSPLFGHGWGSYYYIWPDGITITIMAHNELLNYLYEQGLVGTILLLVCIVSAYLSTLRMIKNSDNYAESVYLRIALATQTFFILYGFTMGTIFSSASYSIYYFLSIAVMLACRHKRALSKQPSSSPERLDD